MTAASLLNPRDSQILQLLRDGAPIQRVIDIGRHRRSWTPIHVGTVVAFHLDDRPALTVVPPPKPEKPRRAAKCGTLSGYSRHTRRGEKACELCLDAKRTYMRKRAAERRGAEPPPPPPPSLPEWAPEPFTGTPTDVILTAAQVAVLEQLCRGLSNGRIAIALDISEDTVKSHMKAVLETLGADDRVHAVVRVRSGQVRVKVRKTGKKAVS